MQHNKRVNLRLFLTIVLCARFAAAQGDAHVQELYSEAKAAQARNDIPAAITKYEEILHLAPKLGPAYNNLGALYFRQREYRKAADVLEKGLKVDPAMTSSLALLGISLYQASDYPPGARAIGSGGPRQSERQQRAHVPGKGSHAIGRR